MIKQKPDRQGGIGISTGFGTFGVGALPNGRGSAW